MKRNKFINYLIWTLSFVLLFINLWITFVILLPIIFIEVILRVLTGWTIMFWTPYLFDKFMYPSYKFIDSINRKE